MARPNGATLCTVRATPGLSAGAISLAAMTSPSSSSDRSDIRLLVYALALIAPPLLAYNRTPSATQLNELLCVFGWGLCLLAAGRTPTTGARRGATTVLAGALGLLCAAVVASWTLGSLPASLALPPMLLLLVACFVAALGARAAQEGDLPDGLPAFAPFAIGMVAVGVLSAVVAVIQVWIPKLADGNLIAQSGLPGRAVGNLRQPNPLASLLVWSVIALVPLVVSPSSFIEQAWAGRIGVQARGPVVRSYTSAANLLAVGVGHLLNDEAEPFLCVETAGEREVEMAALAEAVRAVVNPSATIDRAAPDGRPVDHYVGHGHAYRALMVRYGVTEDSLARQIGDTAEYLRDFAPR